MATEHIERNAAPDEQRVTPGALLVSILFISACVRLAMALNIGIQLDESRMAWTVKTVAERGIPKFPSNVLYLIGTPSAYLFGPFSWLAQGADLVSMIRFGSIVLSLLGLLVVWRLANRLLPSPWVAVAVVAAAAFDPSGLFWGTMASANVTIALFGLLIIATGYDLVTIEDEAILRRLDLSNPLVRLAIWIVLGSFTHYVTWLFVTAVLVAVVVRWGRALLDPRHPVQVTFLIAIMAPILVWMFGSAVGPGSGSSFNPGPPSFGQIWSNVIRLADPNFNLGLWRSMYFGSNSAQWIPILATMATAIVVTLAIVERRDARTRPTYDAPVLVLILGALWIPVLGIADGSFNSLIIGILPIGYLVIAMAWSQLVPHPRLELRRWGASASVSTIVTIIVLLPVANFLVRGAIWQARYDSTDPNYYGSSRYVESILVDNQAVLTTFPAITSMVFSDADQSRIVPLVGPEGGTRLGSEARNKSSRDRPGYYEDYWTGKQAIGTTTGLCGSLLTWNPAPLLLVDVTRLDADWGFRGTFADIIYGGTDVIAESKNGMQVRAPRAQADWAPELLETCGVTDDQ